MPRGKQQPGGLTTSARVNLHKTLRHVEEAFRWLRLVRTVSPLVACHPPHAGRLAPLILLGPALVRNERRLRTTAMPW